MCDTCGCGRPGIQVRITVPGEEEKLAETDDRKPSGGDGHDHGPGEGTNHGHGHEHYHPGTGTWHSHDHDNAQPQVHTHPGDPQGDRPGGHTRRIEIEQDALARNNLLAERNRGYFEARNVLALNLVSSPGSGKTCLLERTIRDLGEKLSISVIEGDQQTMNDANRIRQAGGTAVQVNTGEGCHLDAEMVHLAVQKLNLRQDQVLMIENVGNLVCPALFDLGETRRVVVMSVTEGEDKPLKYPYMFRSSDLCIINKTDLLPHLDFDLEKARQYAMQVNPRLQVIELSVRSGDGMDSWYEWITDQRPAI